MFIKKIEAFVGKHLSLFVLAIFALLFLQTCGSFFSKGNSAYSSEQIAKIAKDVETLKEQSCKTATKADLEQGFIFTLMAEKSLDRNTMNQEALEKLINFQTNCE